MFRFIAAAILSISTSAIATCPAYPADVASECLVDAIQKADKQLARAYQKLIPEAAPNDPDETGQARGKSYSPTLINHGYFSGKIIARSKAFTMAELGYTNPSPNINAFCI